MSSLNLYRVQITMTALVAAESEGAAERIALDDQNVTLTQVGTFGFGTQPHWLVEAFDAALPAKHPSAVRREFPWSAKGEAAARAEYARHVDALVKKAA